MEEVPVKRPARILSICAALLCVAARPAGSAGGPQESHGAPSGLDAIYPDLDALYRDLHAHPELSLREEKTSSKLAERLRRLGFEVTEKVGGFGVVGILRNGPGSTVMVRSDMDALPIEEKTGVPYASRERSRNEEGGIEPVMHACGHDVHMTCWMGTAALLAGSRDLWRGTLMMVAQPAEETGSGAAKMLDAGLFEKWKKPDYALALHSSSELAAGTVGYTPGFALANVNSVDVTIFGRGGHGAYPHRTVDPIVIAAKTVLALQTLVSREKNPLDPAVVTVGSIHGGTKHNIIPDEVRLEITLRSYDEKVRKKLLSGIERVAKGEAAAAGAPKEPEVKISEGTPATYNDPELTRREALALRRVLGEKNVREMPPAMGAEDFSVYGRAGVPALIFWLGTVEPARHAAAAASDEQLPSLHSSRFSPDEERTLRTGVTALTAAVLEVLGKP